MEESIPSGSACCFCNTSHVDEALYGKFYKIEEITTHYFCLLLSSKVQQKGSDEEGILGFLPGDIRAEIKRGKSLTCTFCQKRGATISCHRSKCRVHFHLPCGRSRDTLHQFFGEFKSYCCKHRIKQHINREVLKAMSGKQSTCYICLESVPAIPTPSTLWAPCCSKDAWFHRLCIQRLALSAGYFFKCPLCNNTGKFVEAMRTYGIWIPEQDASWERDPERYEGLLQRHNSCDAKSCHCRRGRTYHIENTKWEIKLCADCGSQGIHVQCGNLRRTQDWVCSVCASITSTQGKSAKKILKVSPSHQATQIYNTARRALPERAPQRMTRQVARQRHLSEDGEHSSGTVAEAATSEHPPESLKKPSRPISSPRPLPPASPTFPSPPSPPSQSSVTGAATSKEVTPSCPSPTSENGDVEIIDVAENSDDEIQPQPVKRNEPFTCSCKWCRRNAWPCDDRLSIGSNFSSCCYNRGRKYIHRRKSALKCSGDDLLTRFFSALGKCPGTVMEKGGPRCHHLWVIQSYHSVGCPLDRAVRRSRAKSVPREGSCHEPHQGGVTTRGESAHSSHRKPKEEKNFKIGEPEKKCLHKSYPESTGDVSKTSHSSASSSCTGSDLNSSYNKCKTESSKLKINTETKRKKNNSSHKWSHHKERGNSIERTREETVSKTRSNSCQSGTSTDRSLRSQKIQGQSCSTDQNEVSTQRSTLKRALKTSRRPSVKKECLESCQASAKYCHKESSKITDILSQKDMENKHAKQRRRGRSSSSPSADPNETSAVELSISGTIVTSTTVSEVRDYPRKKHCRRQRNSSQQFGKAQNNLASSSKDVNPRIISQNHLTSPRKRFRTSSSDSPQETELRFDNVSVFQEIVAYQNETTEEDEHATSYAYYKSSRKPSLSRTQGKERSSRPQTRSRSLEACSQATSSKIKTDPKRSSRNRSHLFLQTKASQNRHSSPCKRKPPHTLKHSCRDDSEKPKHSNNQKQSISGNKRKRSGSYEGNINTRQGGNVSANSVEIDKNSKSAEISPNKKRGRPKRINLSQTVMDEQNLKASSKKDSDSKQITDGSNSRVKPSSVPATQTCTTKTTSTKDNNLFCPSMSQGNIRNVVELAKLPHFQPVVSLERQVLLRNDNVDRLQGKIFRSNISHRRERSASVERPSLRVDRLKRGRSRREQFQARNLKDIRRMTKSVSPADVHAERTSKTPRKRSVNRTFKDMLKRSPIRTRSLSRSSSVNRKEHPEDSVLQDNPSVSSKVLIDLRSSGDLLCETIMISDAESGQLSPTISSLGSYKISSSDETDDEIEVEENEVNATVAKISGIQSFVNRDLSSLLPKDVIPYSQDRKLLDECFSTNENSSEEGSYVSSDGLDLSHLPLTCFQISSSASAPPVYPQNFQKVSHMSPHMNSCGSSCLSPSVSDVSVLNHSLFSQASSSCSSISHPPCPDISNPSPLSSSSSSPVPDRAASPELRSIHVPFVPSSAVSDTNQSLECSLSLVSPQFQFPENTPRSATPPPTSGFSPRRSLRSPRNSAVVIYNPQITRRALSDAGSPISARSCSPPPIFRNRSGSPTAMECRIKARALTARKFLPMSHIATEQRAMIRQLQVLQKHENLKQ